LPGDFAPLLRRVIFIGELPFDVGKYRAIDVFKASIPCLPAWETFKGIDAGMFATLANLKPGGCR